MRPLRKVVPKSQTAKSKIKWDEVPGAEQSFLKTKGLISMRPKLFFYFSINRCQWLWHRWLSIPTSKSLSGSQLRWPIIQKEAYAVFYSITHLEYRKFCLTTDHANLVYINKSVNKLVQRWKTRPRFLRLCHRTHQWCQQHSSRLPKSSSLNLMIEEVRKDKELTE